MLPAIAAAEPRTTRTRRIAEPALPLVRVVDGGRRKEKSNPLLPFLFHVLLPFNLLLPLNLLLSPLHLLVLPLLLLANVVLIEPRFFSVD